MVLVISIITYMSEKYLKFCIYVILCPQFLHSSQMGGLLAVISMSIVLDYQLAKYLKDALEKWIKDYEERNSYFG